MPGSECDHLLVGLPCLHGPGLEHCPLPDGQARILRLVPVTVAEMAYRRDQGHEALEQLFDEHAGIPTDPKRRSAA
ncbi:suppressor of fused domain protein [Actinacidiphila paucisporea]|uniref:suppressor of fused domain protein n=1 Tax=Actinacidiphila paucisporea TaxID=310782 RepID=UPI001F1A5715|nr:suppressor of fused domain protein [Actinacidiphila paucisporea]